VNKEKRMRVGAGNLAARRVVADPGTEDEKRTLVRHGVSLADRTHAVTCDNPFSTVSRGAA